MAKTGYRYIVDALENLGFWVYILSLERVPTFSYLSPDFLKVVGYAEDQIRTPLSWSKMVHPEDRDLLTQRDKQWIQGISCTTHYRIISKNGQIFWVSERTTPIVEKGKIIRIVGALRDITEATRVQEALKESEARFRVALQNAPIAVFHQDLGLRYTWLYKPQIVRDPEEAIGKTDFDIFPYEDALISTALKKRILDTGEPIRGEFQVTKNGETHYFDLTGEPLRDASGKIIGINCATMDITKYKTLESKLRESEARFRSIFENAAVGIALFDETGQLIMANEAFCRFFGFPNEDLTKLEIFDFYRQQIFSPEVFPLKDTDKLGIERPFLLKNGQLVWGRLSVSIVKDADNSPQYILVCEDVTQRKQAEQALEQSQKLLQRITDSTPTLIYILDIKEGKCTYVNSTAAAFWGKLDMAIAERIHPEDQKKWGEFLLRLASAEDEEIIENSFRVMNFKGEWRVLRSWNMVFNRTKDGKVCEVLVSSIDDTEHQNALQEIQKYQQQLISLASEISIAEEQERRRIASGLHDSVGQMLAMARMQLRVTQKSIKQRDLCKKLDQVCDLLTEAINQTRSLAIELSPPILQELGFEAAIVWLVDQMNNRYGMSIRLEKEANGDFNLDFEVAVLLYQAVRELLFNVLKHAQVKTAQVLLTRNSGTIKVSVTDSGTGFDHRKIENTFNPEGFGLFSIRERLKYFGGKMEIESAVGRGTKVEISIPVEPPRQKIVKNP